MRQPQTEQIKAARRFYCIALNDPRDGMATHRFAVYTDSGNGLEILWPSDSHLGKKSKELLFTQVYSERQKYPAYHFALSGCGYSKTHHIASTIAEIKHGKRNSQLIEFYCLNGCSPSEYF